MSFSFSVSRYNPTNWYWIVGDDEDNVWSSARASYVPVDDDDYKAWLDDGLTPTKIDTQDNLRDVLLLAYPDGAPPAPVTLESKMSELASLLVEKEQMGVYFTPTGGQSILFPTDNAAQGKFTAAWNAINAGLWADGRPFIASDGTPVPMPTSDAKNLILKALGYVQACVDRYVALHAALQDDLDTDITAGWPANS